MNITNNLTLLCSMTLIIFTVVFQVVFFYLLLSNSITPVEFILITTVSLKFHNGNISIFSFKQE